MIPDIDIPKLAMLHADSTVLSSLLTKGRFPLEHINEATALFQAGAAFAATFNDGITSQNHGHDT